MVKKKLQIFVSSTFEDLKKERQLVIESILEMGHLPAGMEYFISDDAQQFDVIKKWIKESDAYLLIIGGRYGSINPFDPQGRSYTHLEFEYARSIKKPRKILLLNESFLKAKRDLGDYTDEDLNDEKLLEFRKNLPMCNCVNSIAEIKSATKTVLSDLTDLSQKGTCGWIKSADIAPLLVLHPNNVDLARSKSIMGNYYICYYSAHHKRYVYSLLSLKIKKSLLVATLKNDIDENGNAPYVYSGKFEIFDDFLYLELKSNLDNEKVFAMIKLLPGKLSVSIGILLAQGTSKQAAATTFIISKQKIIEEELLDEFRQEQNYMYTDLEKLLIDDESIRHLTENLEEYQKKTKGVSGVK